MRDFLTRAAQPFEWLEDGSPEAEELLVARGLSAEDLPAVLDAETAIAPASVDLVARAWEISATPTRASYDLAIIGTGPAGLAAAVYAASDGLATVALEEDLPGGQASYTSLIENFFGFPEGIGGAELARLAGRQAEKFGAELLIRRGVVGHRTLPGRQLRDRPRGRTHDRSSPGDRLAGDGLAPARRPGRRGASRRRGRLLRRGACRGGGLRRARRDRCRRRQFRGPGGDSPGKLGREGQDARPWHGTRGLDVRLPRRADRRRTR